MRQQHYIQTMNISCKNFVSFIVLHNVHHKKNFFTCHAMNIDCRFRTLSVHASSILFILIIKLMYIIWLIDLCQLDTMTMNRLSLNSIFLKYKKLLEHRLKGHKLRNFFNLRVHKVSWNFVCVLFVFHWVFFSNFE